MTARAALIVLAAGVLISTVGPKPLPHYIWNLTPSVPRGLYAIRPPGYLRVSLLVVAWPPEPLATVLDRGDYLPRGVPLLKRIFALSGQTVCRAGTQISVDHIVVSPAREHDGRGRLLPSWQGCRVIAADEVFLMNWDEPDSLDGRYFGPLPKSSVVARAIPLWTDEAGDGQFVWHAVTAESSLHNP
jgi:conjugative transfer signal peptidase TraF